jgi:hypothetical protein
MPCTFNELDSNLCETYRPSDAFHWSRRDRVITINVN